MAANTSPIYTLTPNINSVLVTAAKADSSGAGTIATDLFKAFTAGANGSFIDRVRWMPVATTPTTMTATVGRVFISSVTSGATTSANTYLWAEVVLPAVAADNASTNVSPIDIAFGFYINASYTILVANHAAPAASTNWRALVIGGDY